MITRTSAPLSLAATPESTDAAKSASIQAVCDANAGGSLSRNLAPENESKGGETPRDTIEAAADEKKNSATAENPTGAVKEESPVVGGQDQKILTGEGEMTSPSADVDSLEGGDTPGAGDGGDAASLDKMHDAVAQEVTKAYQAPGPDSPTTDQPGNPTQDPLTPQVDGVGHGSNGVSPYRNGRGAGRRIGN